MDEDELDLSAGKYLKGIRLNDTTFLVVTKFAQLKGVMRNPKELQPNAKRSALDDDLQDEVDIHELIQRALTGNKKGNVAPYAAYIKDVVSGERVGVLPPMHLWSGEPLEEVAQGKQSYLLIPDGQYLAAIDGETQLTAHFELQSRAYDLPAELKKAHGEYPLGATVHHGVSVRAARQYFHDLNVLAVRPNTSLGLSMDAADPLMKVVGDLEAAIPFLTGRVDKQARQLTKASTKVITLQTLRQMTVNVAKGIAGTQYGARPAPVDDVNLDDLTRVARDWFTAVFNTFASQVVDRENFLLGSAPVLAAIAAMANTLLQASPEQRSDLQTRLLASLEQVDWKKGERWSGIAGRFTPKGVFSVSGTKEVGYSVFNVLADPDNPNYGYVRGQGPRAQEPAFSTREADGGHEVGHAEEAIPPDATTSAEPVVSSF